MLNPTDLATRNTLDQMVITYTTEQKRIQQAYKDLALAQENLEAVFGKHYNDFETLPNGRYYSGDYCGDVLKRIKCSAWGAVVNRMEIRKLTSIARWDELAKKLADPNSLPEVTLSAIMDTITAFLQNANSYVEEAIKEVFNELRQRPNWHGEYRYKTNEKNAKFEIGRKVILSSAAQTQYGGKFRINYYKEQFFIALDKVFFNLDSKGIPGGYRSPLVDAIHTCENNFAETDYFKARCYQNGNLHLEFKRLDLLRKLNAIAGGADLKG